MDKFYITTSIPYVNARPHIGHALEFVQADVIARHRRINGSYVYVATGADENSLKNVLAAEKLGIKASDFCASHSLVFKELMDKSCFSYDSFVRTSADPGHRKVAEELWKAISGRGDIYKKRYRGLYCVGCELFYTESELVDGKCPEHGTRPDVVEEENYFFRLSRYQDSLERLIRSGEVAVIPDSRKAETLNFIRSGLSDFSISRSAERSHGWGIRVPGDQAQVMYVWFDALGNYLTSAGFCSDDEKFRRLWPADMHVIGKGIARFHTIYWPAMLMSAGLSLPKSVFIHGYVTNEGRKMSKSIGNVIDPIEQIDRYGADQIRYYLMKEISTFQDGDFSEKGLRDAINNELVGNLGNFVNRTLSFIGARFDGTVSGQGIEEGRMLLNEVGGMVDEVEKLLGQSQLNFALLKIMEISSMGNRYFQSNEPWKLVKEDRKAAGEVLFVCASLCRVLGILLYPYMPRTSETLLGFIGGSPVPFGRAKKAPDSIKVGGIKMLFSKVE